MAQMPESESSVAGGDDKVYLFFSETAVEYDFYSKLVVSRVAHVCKVRMCVCVCVSVWSCPSISVSLALTPGSSPPSGGPGGPENPAEEVDVLPEGQGGLSSPRVPAALHHPRHLPLV